MSHRALGPQFDPVMEVVHRDFPDLHKPECAAGICAEVSERIQEQQYGQGNEHLRPIGRMRMGKPLGPGKSDQEHVVAVHKGHVIDATLRQFEPDAAVPHIEPIKSYMNSRGYTWAEKD